jgi:hypothetical protein
MGLVATVRGQLEDYPRVHRRRANLALHGLAVPLYWLGLAAIVFGIATLRWQAAAAGVALLLVSIGIQAFGHSLEAERAKPFSGPANFALRLTTESLFVFPHYLASGLWMRAWRVD